MAIKNFFVRGEKLKDGIAGLRYAKYLTSSRHPNHRKTDIQVIYNSAKNWMELSAIGAEKANAKKSLNGGRPTKRYGHSYSFSLPKGTEHPSPEQWKKVSAEIVEALSYRLKIDKKTLLKHCFIVAHNQANPHIHFLVSAVVNGKTINQHLNNERTTYFLKRQFNAICFKHFGLDKRTYEPVDKGDKRVAKIQYEKRLVNKLHKQFQKWLKAILANNQKQYNRQKNRVIKSLDELEKLNPDHSQAMVNEIEKHIPNIKNYIGGP